MVTKFTLVSALAFLFVLCLLIAGLNLYSRRYHESGRFYPKIPLVCSRRVLSVLYQDCRGLYMACGLRTTYASYNTKSASQDRLLSDCLRGQAEYECSYISYFLFIVTRYLIRSFLREDIFFPVWWLFRMGPPRGEGMAAM